MAKFHHHVGAAPPSLPLSSPSPHQQQVGVLLQQDFAKLVDKDPDTRRSAMAALKGYIEDELDVKNMPYFLEQVSGESNKGEASRTYAISLFVEVARVQKHLTIPYIPRIMATVMRSLLSSGGSQNLHQACANVVSSVARFAIEPPTPGVPSRGEDVLWSLCHPLLGILCSKVEPVAVGCATCFQALVESEKWKFAALDLVMELCHRAAMAVGEKGTQTVAHMNLVRSLAKFNPEALQDYGTQLLKAGVEILLAAGGACGSWQQRAAAAQLLSAVLRAVDERTLAIELVPTTEALERCRLDKVAVVRRAIGEALDTAKSLASDIDILLLQKSGSEEACTPPRRPSEPRRRGRRGSMWRLDEASRSQAKLATSGSLESKLVSYASSPSSSFSLSVSASSLTSTANSVASSGRSPLYPAKQSPAMLPSSTGQCTAESGLEYILAHLKSSESKENAPLIGKSAEQPGSMKTDDSNDVFHGSKGSTEHGENGGTTDDRDLFSCEVEQERCSVFSEEDPGELSQASNTEDDMRSAVHGSRYLKSTDSLSLRSGITDMELQRTSTDRSGNFPKSLDEGNDHEECSDLLGEGEILEERSNEAKSSVHSNDGPDNSSHLIVNPRYNSLAHVVNLEAAVSPSQVVKTRMAAEDFLLFATPRRLVRSLQSASSTPESRLALESDPKEELEMEFETLSESGWSVRDNPIADDSEEDSPKSSSLVDRVWKQDKSMSSESSPQKGAVTSVYVEQMISGGPSCLADTSLSEAVDLSDFQLEAERYHQLCDVNMVGHRDADQLKVKGQCHETLNQERIGEMVLMECETSVESAQGNSMKGSRVRGLWLMGVREWTHTVFVRRWSKAQGYIEIFLRGALCAVLVLGVAIVISNCLNGQNDIHVLVPT